MYTSKKTLKHQDIDVIIVILAKFLNIYAYSWSFCIYIQENRIFQIIFAVFTRIRCILEIIGSFFGNIVLFMLFLPVLSKKSLVPSGFDAFLWECRLFLLVLPVLSRKSIVLSDFDVFLGEFRLFMAVQPVLAQNRCFRLIWAGAGSGGGCSGRFCTVP